MNTREFRHLFSSPCRIVATVRVNIARARIRTHALVCVQCEWDGSKVKQPRAELYPEFKEWMDFVLPDTTAQTGSCLIYCFEQPAADRHLELWLYRGDRKPRLIKTSLILAERLAGMSPSDWKEDALGSP